MTTETKEEKSVVEQSAIILSENATALILRTNADRIYAEEMLTSAKTLEEQIFEFLDPARAKAYENYQYHKKRLDDALNPVKEARKTVKQKCMAYDQEQEKIRREAQAAAEAEARKRAEDEQLALAAQLEKEGDQETAEAILQEPVQVAPVIVPRTAPTASRLSAGRSTWSCEVVSLMALVKAVAEGKHPITLIEANMTALNGMARSLKGSMAIPGCKAVEKRV